VAISKLITDSGNTNMAIPVRIAAKDVRFSAKISCASLIIIESLLGVWLAKSHTFLVDKFLYPKAKVRGAARVPGRNR